MPPCHPVGALPRGLGGSAAASWRVGRGGSLAWSRGTRHGSTGCWEVGFYGSQGSSTLLPSAVVFPVLSAMDRDTKASMNQLLTSDCVVSVAGRWSWKQSFNSNIFYLYYMYIWVPLLKDFPSFVVSTSCKYVLGLFRIASLLDFQAGHHFWRCEKSWQHHRNLLQAWGQKMPKTQPEVFWFRFCKELFLKSHSSSRPWWQWCLMIVPERGCV